MNFESVEPLQVPFLEQQPTQNFSIYRPIYANTCYLCSIMSPIRKPQWNVDETMELVRTANSV